MNPKLLAVTLTSLFAGTALADELKPVMDRKTNVAVYELSAGNTVAKFCPGQGANLFSIEIDGTELLWLPKSLSEIGGVSCGVPILYPTPNRVRDAEFTYAGRKVTFEANAGKNFIHGLVNRAKWEVVEATIENNLSTIRCTCTFKDGALAEKFPFPHDVSLTITVRPGVIRWEYEVDNSAGQESVPFGFALHPYFRYVGQRKQTYLTVPATHLMESVDKLPSGELLPVKPPIGKPMSLEGTKYDDVFYGMTPETPARIDYRDVGFQIDIHASKEFTHLVVWTPQRPFFGVESQTCSTDAHNLYASGNEKAAHLQICRPGEKLTGWVEYTVTGASSR